VQTYVIINDERLSTMKHRKRTYDQLQSSEPVDFVEEFDPALPNMRLHCSGALQLWPESLGNAADDMLIQVDDLLVEFGQRENLWLLDQFSIFDLAMWTRTQVATDPDVQDAVCLLVAFGTLNEWRFNCVFDTLCLTCGHQ
jgi:hypothetical protein